MDTVEDAGAAPSKPKRTAAKSKVAPKSSKPQSKGRTSKEPSGSSKQTAKKVKKPQAKKASKNANKKNDKKSSQDKKKDKKTKPVPTDVPVADLDMNLEEEPEAEVESQATEPYGASGVVTRKRKPSVASTLEAVDFDGAALKTPVKEAKQSKVEPAATMVSPPAASVSTGSQESLCGLLTADKAHFCFSMVQCKPQLYPNIIVNLNMYIYIYIYINLEISGNGSG